MISKRMLFRNLFSAKIPQIFSTSSSTVISSFKPYHFSNISQEAALKIPNLKQFIKDHTFKLQNAFDMTQNQLVKIKENLDKNSILFLETKIEEMTSDYEEKCSLYTKFLINLGNSLGVIRLHNTDPNSQVWDIKPNKTNNTSYKFDVVCRSHTLNEFEMHTDCSFENPPPQYMGIASLKKDYENYGYTCFLQTEKVLSFLDPIHIQTLQNTNFKFLTPPDFYKKIPYIQCPILFTEKSSTYRNIRFRHDIIERKDLTETQLQSIDRLQEIVENNKHLNQIQLPEGTVVLFSNWKFLHSRSQIKSMERHLKRIRFDNKSQEQEDINSSQQ